MSARLSDNDLSTLDAAALRDYLRHFVDAGDTETAERILAEQERRRRPGESVGFPPCVHSGILASGGNMRECKWSLTGWANLSRCGDCKQRKEPQG